MSLHFGGGTGHPQQLRGEAESFSIVKCDMERAAVLREPDFHRPRRSGIRRAQGTVLTFSFPVRPMPSGRDQPGPIRLWPGSPTLAPLVVNATELGCWMVLSNTDTPTAAIAANNKAARKTFILLPQNLTSSGRIIRPAWPAECSPTALGPLPVLPRPRASDAPWPS